MDNVFISMALNNDFNLRRIERYLSVAWDSGATTVIVLTKSDVCDNLQHRLDEVPGMRELGIETADFSKSFSDIYARLESYSKLKQID